MAQTRDTLLAVLRRTTDPNWLDGLLDDPDSSALLYALLDILVVVSTAADDGSSAGLISTAPGGQPGTTVIMATRANTSAAAVIPQGYPFVDQRGVQMVLANPVPIAIGQTAIALPLMTLRQTSLVNTIDDAFAFIGVGAYLDTAVGPSGTLITDGVAAVLGPPGTTTGAHFLTLVSSQPIAGGDLDFLSAHGNERGQRRQGSEPTEDYRLRVRNIPDAVTPRAIAQAVQGLGVRLGLVPITIREPYEDGADAASRGALNLTTLETYFLSGTRPNPALSPMVDFWGDPFTGLFATAPALRPRETVSTREGRAYFRVESPSTIANPDGLVFFWDSSFWDDPVWGYPDIHNHPAVISSLMAIWEEANRKRAGGVQFDVLIPTPYDLVGTGHSMMAGATLVVDLTPASGKAWRLMDFVSGHDAARSGVAPDPSTDSHYVVFTFDDASTFTTALWTRLDEQHLTADQLGALGFPFKPIVEIQGYVGGAGVNDVGLVVDARVVDVSL